MTWLHYIGGRYTPKGFIEEARKYGVSRRIPALFLKSLTWGDRVYCATWKGTKGLHLLERQKEVGNVYKRGNAEIFASFRVSRIVIEDTEINQKVQERLRNEGKVLSTHSGSGRMVRRACGYYFEGGGVETSASISEIAGMAEEEATKLGRFSYVNPYQVMIMGELEKVFNPPREINAPFTRSLLRWDEAGEAVIDVEGQVESGELVEIQEHVVAHKKDDFALPLPLGK